MSFSRRGRTSVVILAMWFVVVCAVAAQQPVNGDQPDKIKPGETPTANPVPPAAIGAIEPSDASGKADSRDSLDPSAVRLGPRDMVEVSVYNVPELSSRARISNTGDLYLPLIDYVHVDGLTVEEAQTLVAKRLSDGGFVRNPHVTIFVADAASQGVTLLGEVSKPGIYPDVPSHKLYDFISQAGGFSPSASKKIAIIRRNQPEPIRVNLPRNLADDLSGNVDVLPGDTITVPRAPIIYVVGDVNRPAGFLVDNGTLTVLQAIALAGGTSHTAKLSAARIIHKTATGMTEERVHIKKMLEAKTPDVTLQADDILFVPVSAGKVMAGKTLDVAMAAASAATIYTVHP